jgi:hypothetical protein
MTGKASNSRSHSEDPRAAQLIGVIVLSLGLWVVIWTLSHRVLRLCFDSPGSVPSALHGARSNQQRHLAMR